MSLALILLGVGFALVVLEVFVPAGGVLTAVAIGAIGASAYFASTEGIGTAVLFLAAGAVGVPLIAYSKIALRRPEKGTTRGDAAVQERLMDFAGKAGVATTTLRPAGKARIEGQLVDVVTQGEFIEKDTRIRVLRVEGNRIVVVPEAGETS